MEWKKSGRKARGIVLYITTCVEQDSLSASFSCFLLPGGMTSVVLLTIEHGKILYTFIYWLYCVAFLGHYVIREVDSGCRYYEKISKS